MERDGDALVDRGGDGDGDGVMDGGGEGDAAHPTAAASMLDSCYFRLRYKYIALAVRHPVLVVTATFSRRLAPPICCSPTVTAHKVQRRGVYFVLPSLTFVPSTYRSSQYY